MLQKEEVVQVYLLRKSGALLTTFIYLVEVEKQNRSHSKEWMGNEEMIISKMSKMRFKRVCYNQNKKDNNNS